MKLNFRTISTTCKSAPWPVWRDSVAKVHFVAPPAKKVIAGWKHQLRAWDRQTRCGSTQGIVGRVALAIYDVLAFDFLNYKTGRLDPSLDRLAERVPYCRRWIQEGLKRLRDLGAIGWLRRCKEGRGEDGRWKLYQQTNAYVLLPPSQWKGYADRSAPAPTRDTLGFPAEVAEEPVGLTGSAALDAALAGLGAAIEARENASFTGRHGVPRNPTLELRYTPRPADDDLEGLQNYHFARLYGKPPDG